MANLAAFVAGALGGKGASPADFIPQFGEEEEKPDKEEIERREAAMRAFNQRALAAALNAMAKKTNG